MAALRPILLVEDDPNDVDLTLHALNENGLANPLIVLRDGVAALDYLFGHGGHHAPNSELLPALVLLDLKMPKVDGLEVLRRVRSDPNLREVPVIILTVSRAEGDRLASQELGISAYIIKPVVVESFILAVGEIGLQWGIVERGPEDSP